MNKRQASFGYPKAVIVIGLVIVVGAVGYFVLGRGYYKSSNAQINSVNSLLKQSRIPPIEDWVVNAHCGPTDAFLGYELVPKTEQEISDKQAQKLKSNAGDRGLSVSIFETGGYSIEDDSWKLTIYASSNGDTRAVGAEIFSKDKPSGYPDGSLVCG